MNGYEVGTLCVLTRTLRGVFRGGVVEVISPAFYGSAKLPDGRLGPQMWMQETKAVSFPEELEPGQWMCHPVDWMRPLSDPDPQTVEDEKEVVV